MWNVRITAFLYAASLEDDNDYHLIVGRDPSKSEKYVTVEISGLSPDTSDACWCLRWRTLKSAATRKSGGWRKRSS